MLNTYSCRHLQRYARVLSTVYLVLLNLGMNFGVGVVQRTTPTQKFIPKTSNPVYFVEVLRTPTK